MLCIYVIIIVCCVYALRLIRSIPYLVFIRYVSCDVLTLSQLVEQRRTGQFFLVGAEPSMPEKVFDSTRKTAMLSCKITLPVFSTTYTVKSGRGKEVTQI